MTGPYRLILRGPGDMGGRALLSSLESSDFEVVGAQVFSAHKKVMSAAQYRDPSMATWLSPTRSPLSVPRTVADRKVTRNASDAVRVVRHLSPVPARVRVRAGGTVVEPGTVGALTMTSRGFIGDDLFGTDEMCRPIGVGNAPLGQDNPSSPADARVIGLDGTPGVAGTRNEMDGEGYSRDWFAVTDISVAAMLGVVAELCAPPPGVVMPDLRPHYLLESS
ncbi:hypothetical protein ABZV91_01060 [Nocardia sp. NPDC004568]|uniref:hypothetical protein n=1 Tax=Nocardia sp. NPDC004568 TaxID=3154551 RepID=UPI0033BE1D96